MTRIPWPAWLCINYHSCPITDHKGQNTIGVRIRGRVYETDMPRWAVRPFVAWLKRAPR